MKTAIYTIALNEEPHAEAFMKNVADAELVVVGDSGSTDRTVEIIRDMGGTVVPLCVSPWRFDIPRNTVLSVLPRDVDFCCALDLDERLSPNWRDAVERLWQPGKHTRLRFRYIHNFKVDGSPATVGFKDFAHSRMNYYWQHAVHETLYYSGPGNEDVLTIPELVVEHRQDRNKSRSSYLPLLESECRSLTVTPRHIFWLVREYVGAARWDDVIIWADKFLAYPDVWYVERAHAHRLIAKALSHLKKQEMALAAHFKSVEVAPRERECWMDFAWYYHAREQWAQAYGVISQCLSITNRPEHYLAGEEAWGYKVHELASLCAFKLGMIDRSREHIVTAIKLGPGVLHLVKQADRLGLKDVK